MQNRPRLCACFILIIYSLIKCEDKKPTESLWLCPAYRNNRGVTTRHTSMVSLMSLCLSFFCFSVCIRKLFAQLSTLTTVWSKPVCLVCPRAKVQARCAGQGEGERQRMAQGWGVAEKKTKWRLCESTRTDWQVKAARQDREPWYMTRNLEQQEAATNTTSCSRQLKIKTAASTLRRHETAFWRASPFPVTATRRRRYESIVISCHRHEPLSVCTSFFFFFSFSIVNNPPDQRLCCQQAPSLYLTVRLQRFRSNFVILSWSHSAPAAVVFLFILNSSKCTIIVIILYCN